MAPTERQLLIDQTNQRVKDSQIEHVSNQVPLQHTQSLSQHALTTVTNLESLLTTTLFGAVLLINPYRAFTVCGFTAGISGCA